MQSRFIVKGSDAADNDLVLAYELKEEEFKVNLYVIPRKSLSSEQMEKLQGEWISTGVFDFPEDTKLVNPNLNAESVLPEDIRSEEAGKIRNQQNEWAYQLLTAKLWESYLLELEELKKRSNELTQYDRQLFDDAKSFWERVLEHRKERDISQERLDKIKDDVNAIFERLKTFRKTETAEFEGTSGKLRDEFLGKLESIKGRAGNKANFKNLMEELKAVQTEARKNRFTKGDEHALRKAFDSTYQFVNDQRNHFFNDITETRIKGLKEVIEKMEASLERDKKDLEYMSRKANSNSIKSLELQLIKVKTNMLHETMASKEEKLKDIRHTLDKLLKQAQRTHKHPEQKTTDEPVVENDGGIKAEEATHPDEPNPAGE